jgi:hypothetical protein
MKTNYFQDKAAPAPVNTPVNSDKDTDSLGGVPIIETDNLDETVLGAASVGHPDQVPPEVVRGTEALTEWDEPADTSGTWTPREGRDGGTLEAERLVEAGNEEADRERRLAAGEIED